MLDKKGFTLVELLAMMVILGILMAVTIPNIVGIAEANKKQAYAEDALKFKNSVEYLLRSSDEETYLKPESDGDCVVVSLAHLVADEFGNVDLAGTEYENAPNGGKYLVDSSFVVMLKSGGEYKYYVQLIEKISSSRFQGVKLINYMELESSKYLDKIISSTDVWGTFVEGDDKIKEDTALFGKVINDTDNESSVSGKLSCNVKAVYYSN